MLESPPERFGVLLRVYQDPPILLEIRETDLDDRPASSELGVDRPLLEARDSFLGNDSVLRLSRLLIDSIRDDF